MILAALLEMLKVLKQINSTWDEILRKQQLSTERITLVSEKFESIKANIQMASDLVDTIEVNLSEISTDIDTILQRLAEATDGLSASETQEVAESLSALKAKAESASVHSRADADKV